MDNELDQRLSRLEAGQAKQGEHLMQLLEDQQRMLRALTDLTALMKEPDEDGVKLQDVLTQLATVIGSNTATLASLEKAIRRRAAQSN